MRAVNLYVLSRDVPECTISSYEKALSNRNEAITVRTGEISLIRTLIDCFILHSMEKYGFENWFYSFRIPQISKEFDLLKISKDGRVLNIELKNGDVSSEKIENQLVRNRYYLSVVSKSIVSYTCIKRNDGKIQFYKYDNGRLLTTSIEKLVGVINSFTKCIDDGIEKMFRPRDFLISPLNTPEKFLNDMYYLNSQQEEIKNKILKSIGTNKLWGITGAAGTGKTLLLYDIAKAVSEMERVLIIHCGILNDGHKFINKKMENLSVVSAKEIRNGREFNNEFVFVDETQRMYKSTLYKVLEAVKNGEIIGCVFSYDRAQSLSNDEIKWNNPKSLKEVQGFQEEKLTDRIRTNKEIATFIHNMMHLNYRPQQETSYDCIDILYAENTIEADRIIDFYKDREYTVISFTPSMYVYNEIDHYSSYINSHQVIGQEFDNVIVIIDSNFRYNEDGILGGKIHPNPNYLFSQLFYQNITRARERLCIVVQDNRELFEKLIALKA